MQDREIASLREQVEQANPPKRRKIATNPNDLFASLAYILSQTNREPSQRVRKVRSAKQQVVIVEEESSSEEEAGATIGSTFSTNSTTNTMVS